MNRRMPGPDEQGIVQTMLDGLGRLLSNASHQPLKKITLSDPIMVSVKTFLGGMGFAKADTTVTIEVDETAQGLIAEGEKLALEGEKLASEIEATGKAEALKIAAEGGQQIDGEE